MMVIHPKSPYDKHSSPTNVLLMLFQTCRNFFLLLNIKADILKKVRNIYIYIYIYILFVLLLFFYNNNSSRVNDDINNLINSRVNDDRVLML